MKHESRRSGINRRQRLDVVDLDRRKKVDRRDVINDSDRIIGFMKKIPIFKGLTNEQYREILNICSKKVFPKDHFICQEGDDSNELFILLKGKLKVVLQGGTMLATISPLNLVGEIGVFADTKRSASVVAATDSTVINISKKELSILFKNDCVLSYYILINVIRDLARKIKEDNEIIEELRNKKRTRIL